MNAGLRQVPPPGGIRPTHAHRSPRRAIDTAMLYIEIPHVDSLG